MLTPPTLFVEVLRKLQNIETVVVMSCAQFSLTVYVAVSTDAMRAWRRCRSRSLQQPV